MPGTRKAGGEHKLFGPQRQRLAAARRRDRPFTGLRIMTCSRAECAAPEIDLHDLGIDFQPIGDLVLGRVERPMIREGQVGEMVEKDGVVQVEGMVARTPTVARPFQHIYHQCRHAQPLEARSEHQAVLAAPDDETIGLNAMPEGAGDLRALVEPGAATLLRRDARCRRGGALRRFLHGR